MHSNLTNLKRKWQYYEQNNFVLSEFTATKSFCQPVMNYLINDIEWYHKTLLETLENTQS